MSFKLSTNILRTLIKVRDQELNVMEAFDIISEELSKEFDEFEREIINRYEEDD